MAKGVTVDFTANLTRFSSGIDKATSELNKFQSNASRMSGNLKGIFSGIGLGAGLSVAGIAALARSSINAADAFKDMSDRTGVAVETLAGWKLAAEQSGTQLDGLAKGIQKLTLSIGQAEKGSKEQAQALRELGITARDPKTAFEQLADAVKNSNDPIKTNAELQKVLGINYAELIPLLKGGAQGLRDSAAASETFAKQMAKMAPDAEKFNNQLDQMKTATAGLAAGILVPLLPRLNDWLGATNKLIERHGVWLGVLSAIGAAAIPGVTAAGIAGTEDQIEKFTKQIDKKKFQLKALENTERIFFRSPVTPEILALKEEIRLNEISLKQGIARRDVAAKQKPTPLLNDNTAAIACIGDGGKWDGSKCVKAPAKSGRASAKITDPLAGVLNATDSAKLKELDKSLVLLESRFAAGKVGPIQYAEALKNISGEIEKIKSSGDVFGGSFISKDDSVRRFIEDQQTAVNSLNGEMANEGVAAVGAYKSALDSLLSDTAVAKTDALYKSIDILNKEFFNGELQVTQYEEAIKNLTGKGIPDLKDKTDEATDKMKQAIKGWGNDSADAITKFVTTGKASFSDLTRSILADIAKMIIQKNVTGPLFNFISGIINPAAAAAPAVVPSANGNVFNSPGLSAYSGSVVSRPTLFPFASGVGLMGEAGAEAILPLKRGADGKLGVAGGGSGQAVNITINNTIGDVASKSDVVTGMQTVRGQIVQQFSRNQRYGGAAS